MTLYAIVSTAHAELDEEAPHDAEPVLRRATPALTEGEPRGACYGYGHLANRAMSAMGRVCEVHQLAVGHALPAHLAEPTEDDPITDSGGYLSCGCHGSQPDHSCGPSAVSA